MLDRKFFRKISADVVMNYRKHIFDPAGGGSKAKQVDGKSYPNYTQKYRQRKSSRKFKRQDDKFAGSKAPVLSGDLYKDYGFHKYLPNGFAFGFKSEGAKVKRLAELGRVLSSKQVPIPKSVGKFIEKEAEKYVKKELKKTKGGTFNIGR